MAVKTLYFKNVTTNGALSLQDGGTAPTGAITTSGWTVAKLATPNYSILVVGTKGASGTFATTDRLTGSFTAGSCFRTENPITGAFANTNWSLAFRIRAVSAASSQTGQVRIRLWRSTNADGTGATQITSATQSGTTTAALSTTVSQTSTVTYAPGAIITLSNQYLWVQCEWFVSVASGSNSGDAVFYVESAGAITTPDFTPQFTGTGTLVNANPSTLASIAVGSSTGTGALTSAVSTLAGSGIVLAPPQAAVSWVELSGVEVVTVGGAVTGTGVLLSQTSTLIASGLSKSIGTSILTSVNSIGVGSGVSRSVSTSAALVASNSTIVSAGISRSVSTLATLAAPVSTLSSVGVSRSVSTLATLNAPSSSLLSSGISTSFGTGILIDVGSVLVGSGTAAVSAVTGTGILLAASAVLIGIDINTEYLYPDADAAIGGWTDQAGGTTNLYQTVDEATANDTDYVQSSFNPTNDIIRFRMSDPTTTVGIPFDVSYRYGITGVGPSCTITARLKQGNTVIKSWPHTDAALALKTVSQSLSAGELASITNFNDLFVEFEAGP